MLAAILGAGLLLSSISSLPYMRDVMRGRARPQLVSWGVWAVLLAAMTYIAVREGQVASAVLSTVSAIGCAAILVIGWRRASRVFGVLDKLSLVGAVLGLGVLFVQRDPVIAIVVMLIVDTIAYIPTLLHAWREPEEESLTSWVCSAAGSVLLLIAALVSHASVTGLLYPVYSAVFGITMLALLLTGRVRSAASYQTEMGD